MKYSNPIIPGFYPDPSICRVKKDYYLVNSSFEYFPGVPIFHSKDLINWQQIGYCLNRKSQLNLHKAKSSGGIFAPSIRYHHGYFYMITTNSSHGWNFYVYTDDPAGEWSEPIYVKQDGIDPSLYFDDNGRVYLTSDGLPHGIYQSEIDIKTGKLLTKPKFIWKGTGGKHPEGPHLYKINNMYYLMIAEGGTEYGHMETIARSKSPWGPYESCPNNPILTHRHRSGHPIQATGHADLIEAHDGTWWIIFLGIRPNGYPPCYHLGRETFIAPVRWTNEGWPVVYKDGTVELEMEAECLQQYPCKTEDTRDDFDSPTLKMCWNFLRNPYDKDWSLTDRTGWLRLKGSKITLNDIDSPAFIGRRQQHFNFIAKTLIEFNPKNEQEEAGLTIYMNNRHHYEIGVTRLEDKKYVFVRRRIGDLSVIVTKEVIEDNNLILIIEGDKDKYTFSYKLSSSPLKTLITGETRYLCTEVAGGFTGIYLAIYATGNGQECACPADFDWFEYIVK